MMEEPSEASANLAIYAMTIGPTGPSKMPIDPVWSSEKLFQLNRKKIVTEKLWYMNADFETELDNLSGNYRPLPYFQQINRGLSEHLLLLTNPGDAMLVEPPWPETLVAEADHRGVTLTWPNEQTDNSSKLFTPCGWTPSAIEICQRVGAVMPPISLEIVRRVNSKLFSHSLEFELGVALPGSGTRFNI